MSRNSVFFFLLLLSGQLLVLTEGCKKPQEGYSVNLSLKNIDKPVKVFLNYYGIESFEGIDSLMTDANGSAEFSGSKPLKTGMYSIGIQGKQQADFFISNSGDQHFSVAYDPEYLKQTIKFRNSPENEAFVGYLRSLEAGTKKMQVLQSRMNRFSNNPDSVVSIREKVKTLMDQASEKSIKIENKFQGSLISLYLRTNRKTDIPEPQIPLIASNREQLVQEYYYNQTVAHYFDNIDFSDSRLLKLPVFKQKIDYFFTQLINTESGPLKAKFDEIFNKSSANSEIYSWLVKYLYNLFRESPLPEHADIPAYIAENYILPKSEMINDSSFVAKVHLRAEKAKLNPVGAVATNLKLQTPEGKTIALHNTKAKLTFLYFFNPGCDACHEVTKKLSALYSIFNKNGINVYAVYLDRNREEWLTYIREKKLDWINVYDQQGTEGVEQKYDVNAIPMIYLLDKDKKVLAKDIPVDALESYLVKAGMN